MVQRGGMEWMPLRKEWFGSMGVNVVFGFLEVCRGTIRKRFRKDE